MAKGGSQSEGIIEQLRQLLRAYEMSGRALLPSSSTELLESIVDAASQIFGAAAASIALIDETNQVIEFMVASGEGNENLVGKKISLDSGIAGYVVMTGQPLAISDVRQDPRFNQEFAESTGYVPNSILATPLVWNDRVIGVMEVLDKIDEPSFGLQDMELLGLFARQAAIAIYQSQQYDQIGEAFIQALKELIGTTDSKEVGEILKALEEKIDPEDVIQDVHAIARQLNVLCDVGEAERKTCLQILRTFDEYLHSKPKLS